MVEKIHIRFAPECKNAGKCSGVLRTFYLIECDEGYDLHRERSFDSKFLNEKIVLVFSDLEDAINKGKNWINKDCRCIEEEILECVDCKKEWKFNETFPVLGDIAHCKICGSILEFKRKHDNLKNLNK